MWGHYLAPILEPCVAMVAQMWCQIWGHIWDVFLVRCGRDALYIYIYVCVFIQMIIFFNYARGTVRGHFVS